MTGPTPDDRPIAADRLPPTELFVEEWAGALLGGNGGNDAAAARPDLVRHLRRSVGELARVLGSEEFGAAGAERVGGELVAAYRTDPSALGRSLDVLGSRLVALASSSAQVRRVTRTLGAVAAGYAQAVCEAGEARFSAVFTNRLTGIGIADADGRIVDVNPALCAMFDLGRDELLGSSIYRFVRPDDEPGTAERIERMASGLLDHVGMQKSFTPSSGRQVWTDVDLSLVRDPDGGPRHVVATFVDVSERRRLQATLRYQAEHDLLTGLPNRALFVAGLDRALRAATPAPFGICYLDVDGFRTVNDTHGHGIGDRLLQVVAARLGELVDPSRDLVARLGGDEFVLLVRTGPDEVRSLGRAIVERLREPVVLDDRTIRVSASVGVVDSAERCSEATALMNAADSTLHWAKDDGRDRSVVFDHGRYREDVQRTDLSSQLVGAVGRGEFVVEYQPLVRLYDRELVGVEALVRWQRPGRPRLGPESFIALAEQNGMIVELGFDVLRTACVDARAWSDAHPGTDLLLSVNVSARQLDHPDAVETVTRILTETGWPPERLQLELVERDVMTGPGAPVERLGRLADAGIRIAIDDFGTGYSNLGYLHTLPLHGLKIAGTFVTRSAADDTALLGAIVDMAHSLGLDVVAEAVETAEQAEILTELGCDVAQGWFFGRPGEIGATGTRRGGVG